MMVAKLVIKARVKMNHEHQSMEGFLSQTSGSGGFPDMKMSPGPEGRLRTCASEFGRHKFEATATPPRRNYESINWQYDSKYGQILKIKS